MSSPVFVDTSALVALAGSRDRNHARALAIAKRHLSAGGTWIGTTMVLAELHGLLVKRTEPAMARRTLSALLDDPAYRWLDAPADVVREAIGGWLERYHDQRFTLTDAVSFEVMRRARVRHAFAFDVHFTTAGFELLT